MPPAMWNGFLKTAGLLRPALSTVFAPATVVAVSTYLLLASVVLLLFGAESLANRAAVCALYLLTASVFLLLGQHVLQGRGNDEHPAETEQGDRDIED